ncbi:MAG: exodeoxyribonuclease III [Rhodocyclaceae bacterium]|nr:exodeoxyribonuclease III [Rhodocyclaceae bacterium]
MKLATWNVNSLKARGGQLLEWLNEEAPDVVCLQETKTEDAGFPYAAMADIGYHALHSGQKTYNGVAILSRRALFSPHYDLPGMDDGQKRLLAATVEDVRVVCVYVPNGQAVGSQKFAYKLAWLAHLQAWLDEEKRRHPRLVVAGDFNIAPEDRDVYDPEGWREQVLCSSEERAAFRALLAAGFVDAFRLFEQPEKSYTWWDYRMLAFRRNHGLRIDHVLLSNELATRCRAARIDKRLRAKERPSDHAPVIVELDER